jgi:hypothetical protein
VGAYGDPMFYGISIAVGVLLVIAVVVWFTNGRRRT